MRIFVTGGTGFIGGYLVKKLLARGDAVTMLARNPKSDAAQSLEAAGAVVVQGDVTDRESMRAGMQGAEVVFHVAGWFKLGVRDTSLAYDINVEGTRNTLGLAVELSVRRILYVSTMGVFGDTGGQVIDPVLSERDGDFMSEYDRTKYLAHLVADEYIKQGAPLIICCPGLVYGPDDPSLLADIVRLMLQRKIPMMPAGKSGGSWAHVEDLADGLLLASDKGQLGETYVMGGDVLTYADMAKFVGELSGIRTPLVIGNGIAPVMKAAMSVVSAIMPVPPHFHPDALAAMQITWTVSHEKAVRELGYNPRSYQEGLRETVLYEMDKLGLGR